MKDWEHLIQVILLVAPTPSQKKEKKKKRYKMER